jgi:hypothetical protein
MKHKNLFIIVVLSLLALPLGTKMVSAQTREFQIKKLKQYWRDQYEQPWSDLSYRMAVRLDPLHAKDVGDEISITDPPIKYTTGEWRFYSLQRDARGTFAEVDYLVYKDSSEPIGYEIELRKGNKAVPFLKGSREIKVSNDSVTGADLLLKDKNPIFLKDWLFLAGIILLGLILIYVLIFRWLFSGLLFKRRWAVSSAEHFTWSLSLLTVLALAAVVTILYLGPRPQTWIIIGVLGAFWLLHGVVWLVSGKEA